MEKNSAFVSLGKLKTPKNQILQHHQGTQKYENNERFKVDTVDFPTLNESPVKSKDSIKTSVGCSKATFSYSDKLKASPQEPVISQQPSKFGNNSNNRNKSELNYNKIQLLHVKNNPALEIKNPTKNYSQTNLDAGKVFRKVKLQSFNSQPNSKLDFSTGSRQISTKSNGRNDSDASPVKGIQSQQQSLNPNPNVTLNFPIKKSLPPNDNSIKKELETRSIIPLSIERPQKANNEGWTVYQKHPSTKKNPQDNFRETTNNSFRANCRVTEQTSGSKLKNENNQNSPTKNKPNFIKYRENATSNYKGNEVKSASLEQTDERYRFGSKPDVPYKNCDVVFKCPKPNAEAHNSLSTSSHPLKQTTNKAPELDIKSRIRTPDKNTARKDYPFSNQNQFKLENRLSSNNNKTQPPSEPKSTEEVTIKSKKKRKSKVKRLAALQTGKLHILTPEAHSRILNQSSKFSVKSQSSAVTNVNDEEYPELGMAVGTKNNKEIPCQVKVEPSILSEKYGLELENCHATTSQSSIVNDSIEGSDTKVEDIADEKITEDAKLPVHSNDPITFSLFDILLTGKAKKKELEEKVVEEDSTPEDSPVKLKVKKVINQPVNPLASSKLTAKRGKEREQPKAKKPTKMRKLILKGRQMKKENIIQESAVIENGEKSYIGNDDSIPSLTKSPEFEDTVCGTTVYDSSKDNSNTIIGTLEDNGNSVPIMSCKKTVSPDEGLLDNEFLLESWSLSTQSSPTKFKNAEINEARESIQSTDSNSSVLLDAYCEDSIPVKKNDYKSLDKDNEISFENCDILDTHIPEDYDETSHDVQNYSLDLQNEKICEESTLFEEGLKCQFIEKPDSTLDAYCNTLVQSIILHCIAEISLNSVKYFNEIMIEVSDENTNSLSKVDKTSICTEVSKNYESTGYEENKVTERAEAPNTFNVVNQNQLKNIINDYCSSLIQSILDECFSEIKSLENKRNSSCDISDKLTLMNDNLPNNNLLIGDVSTKFTLPSKTENLEELSKNNYHAANVAETTSILEDDLEKIDISSTINENSAENISEGNICSLSLENSSTVIEPEPLQSKFTDKEKIEAVKILLHTRRFRDYCTHFPTKDLEETIFNLIDDLARFQDRLHQKDPAKARIKRRLLYGIKEIKKHMKLKKLKGIIIATDIEDNKPEGGLNDLLKEVLSLSEAYHIPYVFSHKRFNLGKVCRKSAPVSCVGILNYEGSEKNFKKMLELQEESKCDYIALTKKIVQGLTDNHIDRLFDTIKKGICPYEINKIILKELFGTNPTEENEKPETVPSIQNAQSKIEHEKCVANIDTKYLVSVDVENTYGSGKPVSNECTDSDYFGTLDDLDRTKMQAILKKYNVIKT